MLKQGIFAILRKIQYNCLIFFITNYSLLRGFYVDLWPKCISKYLTVEQFGDLISYTCTSCATVRLHISSFSTFWASVLPPISVSNKWICSCFQIIIYSHNHCMMSIVVHLFVGISCVIIGKRKQEGPNTLMLRYDDLVKTPFQLGTSSYLGYIGSSPLGRTLNFHDLFSFV